jgi:hypothetical protein
VIQLRDATGNDVKQAGVSVTAAIASGPGRLVGTTSRTTDAEGRATFTDLAISGTAGIHTLIFAAPGFTSAVSASVTVSAAANAAPTAADDGFSVTQDQVLSVPAPGVLDNDTDPENDPLNAAIVTQAANGTVALRADGSFDYAPNPGFSGTDSFTYQAGDGSNTSPSATVTITVNAVVGVNDPPSFLPGPNQYVHVGDGPQTVVGWATAISPGPYHDEKLFAVDPAVSSDGTLTYTPRRQGTANGGRDTSPEHTIVFAFE